eukprot:EG_transcript_15846
MADDPTEDLPDAPAQGQGLAERMKGYEAVFDTRLEEGRPFIVRLDGHKFSTFTRGFEKPFDERLHRAMVKTAADALSELHCQLAYTQSDEISLVFMPRPTPEDHSGDAEGPAPVVFSGRVQKLASLAASLCAARFGHHLRAEAFGADEARLRDRVDASHAYFDGRAFSLPSSAEVLNALIWRSSHDCVRNSRLNLGLQHFSHRAIHGMKTADLIVKLQEEKGVSWEAMPAAYKYGTFLKKERIEKEGLDPRTGQATVVHRTKVVAKAFPLRFADPFLAMLEAKHWADCAVGGDVVWEQPTP